MMLKYKYLILIALFLSCPSLVYSAEKTPVAVSELSAKGVSGMEASVVSDFLRDALINTGAFQIVERSSMEQILNEQKFQMTGCTSDECAVRMGKLLNVKKMLMGSLSKLGNMYYISVRMVDVESGSIASADTVSAESIDKIQPACIELANRLASGKSGRPTIAPSTPVSTEEGEGMVEIQSKPTDSYVFINGESRGKTPLELSLPAGSYDIQIKKGDRVWEDTIKVRKDITARISARLDIAQAKIEIESTPKKAKIYINGRLIGLAPITKTYKSGVYKLKMSKPGYKTYKTKLQLKSGESRIENISLEKISKMPKRLGVGVHYSGVSFRYFMGTLTLEGRIAGADKIGIIGPRFYLNLNPRSRFAVLYLGGELAVISGESELQKFTGNAVGLFLGTEIFINNKISFNVDIGPYNVSLKSEYEGIEYKGNYTVGSMGIHYYFITPKKNEDE
ncbi:MAG: PEGA domain-containing protein [Endomicrobiales bacterium]|nr:PEGA domain-containing protein [Endomicrobiales bacterium]